MVWYTPGTTAVLDYAITGAATGSSRSNLTVSGGKTFNGQNGLLEVFNDQTTTYTAPAALASAGASPTQSRFYFTENGTVSTDFGGTLVASVSSMGLSITTNTTVTYNPARVDRRYTLAVGASNTTTTSMTAASSTNFGAVPATTATTTTTVTYIGQESITVPAGTFTACKFTIAIGGDTSTEWVGKGNGAPLQATSKASDGSSVTLKLTSATRINGAPL